MRTPIGLAALLLNASLSAGCFDVQLAPNDDAGTPDAALSDVDVVGTWRSCERDLTFGADGTVRLDVASGGCSESGTYVVHGTTLDTSWGGECDHTTGWHREIARSDHVIVLLEPDNGHATSYADDTYLHTTYRLTATDGSAHATILRVIGSTSSAQLLTGCYWSADLACGGLFSCSGNVSQWSADASSMHATTSCGGGCPCGAVLTATANSHGGYDGSFSGANCMQMFSGTFTAEQVPTL